MNKLDPKVFQEYKDKACKLIQECDEIEIDTDFGLTDGIPSKNGYRTFEYGNRTDVFKTTKYKKRELKWEECTAGQALDALNAGKTVQRKVNGVYEWKTFCGDCETVWTFVRYGTSFRKEV